MHTTTWLTTYTLAYHTYVRDCISLYIYRFYKGVIFHCQVWLPECKFIVKIPTFHQYFLYWEGARVFITVYPWFTHGQNRQSLPPADPLDWSGLWDVGCCKIRGITHTCRRLIGQHIGRFPYGEFPIGKGQPHVFHRCFLMPFET